MAVGEGVGVCVGVGVCDGVGDGVGGAVNIPAKIVAVPFFTVTASPAIGVGTVPPFDVVRFNMPLRCGPSVIVPILVVL